MRPERMPVRPGLQEPVAAGSAGLRHWLGATEALLAGARRATARGHAGWCASSSPKRREQASG